MPTYEYFCPRGHRFERFVRKISDAEAAPACPECGERAARLISGAGLVFKGSGFYITDYGKDGKKKQPDAAPAKSDGAPGEGAKAEGAKSEGAKGEGATGEGAKSEGAKSEGATSESGKGANVKRDAPSNDSTRESGPPTKPKGGE